MKKKYVACLVASGLASAAAAQHSAPPAPAFAAPNLTPKGVAEMAANCAMCHGTRGVPAPGSSVARLAGRSAESTADAMNAFREGKRDATVMNQIAKGYSDAEIAAMAAYFARQREGS
jgi:cytochrome c553